MYYSNNVFDLPPGPLVVTRELFANIQPEYIALMKHFSLRYVLLGPSLPFRTVFGVPDMSYSSTFTLGWEY